MTKKYEDAFIIDGFSDWKKARERFEHHQVSECHIVVKLRPKCFQAPSVIDQLEYCKLKTQSENMNSC